jgi:hypothetical protein
MRVVTQLAAEGELGGVSVERQVIRAQTARWTEPEVSPGYRLTFVRQGIFRARVGGHVLLADPALAYAGGPGVEQSIAHRVGAQDVCTSVRLPAELLTGLVPAERPLGVSVPVSGAVAVAERLLVRGPASRPTASNWPSGRPGSRHRCSAMEPWPGEPWPGEPWPGERRPGSGARPPRPPSGGWPIPRARPWPPIRPGWGWPTWPGASAARRTT